MAKMKTQPTEESVSDYLAEVSDAHRRSDCLAALALMKAGKSCLYVKRLADIDIDVLREILSRAVQRLSEGPAVG